MTPCPRFPSKRSYSTKAAAKLAIRRMRYAQMRGNIEAYRCPSCSSWHVGHRPGSPREAWGSAA